jgi:hypothetical protein
MEHSIRFLLPTEVIQVIRFLAILKSNSILIDLQKDTPMYIPKYYQIYYSIIPHTLSILTTAL